MVELIKVSGCKDPSRWYAKFIGQSFMRLADHSHREGVEWKVRTNDGHSNFILHDDGEVVESLPLVGDLQIDPATKLAPRPDMRKLRYEATSFKSFVSMMLDKKYDSLSDHYPDVLESLVVLEEDLKDILWQIDNPEQNQ